MLRGRGCSAPELKAHPRTVHAFYNICMLERAELSPTHKITLLV